MSSAHSIGAPAETGSMELTPATPVMTPLADPQRLAVAFAGVLELEGIRVPVSSLTLFVDALAAVGLAAEHRVFWAGRATLVHRPEDVAGFGRAFERFWLGRRGTPRPTERAVPVVVELAPEEADESPAPGDDEGGDDRDVEVVRYSAVEVLRHKDFAAYTEADFEEARHLLAALRAVTPGRRSRRLRRVPGRAARQPDLRRTVRRALRTAGEPVSLAWRAPARRSRRLVLLCDVSGSMEQYSRALLRFAHASATARNRVEVFALGTRLTRLSRQLQSRDPDAALGAAARAVPDWSGGTRLGVGLREFNDRWGVRGMARGAVVVILSDGWDRGDPDALSEQMGRLHRVAHQIVWVNPLKAAPGYAPLARGMAAALPWVDAFVEGHSLAALESLVSIIAG